MTEKVASTRVVVCQSTWAGSTKRYNKQDETKAMSKSENTSESSWFSMACQYGLLIDKMVSEALFMLVRMHEEVHGVNS